VGDVLPFRDEIVWLVVPVIGVEHRAEDVSGAWQDEADLAGMRDSTRATFDDLVSAVTA
jgi:hypothetical protein